jgi:hypothetical protein
MGQRYSNLADGTEKKSVPELQNFPVNIQPKKGKSRKMTGPGLPQSFTPRNEYLRSKNFFRESPKVAPPKKPIKKNHYPSWILGFTVLALLSICFAVKNKVSSFALTSVELVSRLWVLHQLVYAKQ